MTRPENFLEVVCFLGKTLAEKQYAFRGTTSLVLQGLDMNVDDIDILCDQETALACNDLLKEYLVDEVAFKESPQFKSFFGKFNIQGIPVDVMGEWQIKDSKGNWSDSFDASKRNQIWIDDLAVFVTPIEEELSVFAKMGRWTAYQKIKRQFEEKNNKQESLF